MGKRNNRKIVEKLLGSDADGQFAFAHLAIYFAAHNADRYMSPKEKAKRGIKDARAMLVALVEDGVFSTNDPLPSDLRDQLVPHTLSIV